MPEAPNVVPHTASSIISGKTPMLQSPSLASQTAAQWRLEAIKASILAYYFAALTNISCQAYMFPAEPVEENDVLKRIIEASYAHFCLLDDWSTKLDPQELYSSPNAHLFIEAHEVLKPLVKGWPIRSVENHRTG
jgi:hypothetical protein